MYYINLTSRKMTGLSLSHSLSPTLLKNETHRVIHIYYNTYIKTEEERERGGREREKEREREREREERERERDGERGKQQPTA